MTLWALALVFIVTMLIEIPVVNANSLEPDQMPQTVEYLVFCTVCQLPIWGFADYNGISI